MTTNFILGSATALLITGAASADFCGFEGTVSTNDYGNAVVRAYALFESPESVVLNVFEANATDNCYIHSDAQIGAGGTWDPTASLDIPGFADPTNDSYVTIGSDNIGPTAGIGFDGNTPFALGCYFPVDAGWYANPPSPGGQSEDNGQGKFAVLVAQFVLDGVFEQDDVFTFSASIGYSQGVGTEVMFSDGSFTIPTPGALALLGLGGLATRRRRG